MSMYSFGNDLYTGRKSFSITGKRYVWFAIGVALMALSVGAFFMKGLTLGIDFSGGSQFTISQAADTGDAKAREVLKTAGLDAEQARVTKVGASSVRVQVTDEMNSDEATKVRGELAKAYSVPEDQVTSTYVGPAWGKSVSDKALRGFVTFLVLVSAVLWIYFRTWTIAVGAIGALFHDLVITVGVYVIAGFEVTPSTVIGLLTILGYSLYDTVVVFDKVRENTRNVRDQSKVTFEESANLAVNQTLIRSLNTSITGLLPVAAILFIGVLLLGAGTLRDLALVLFVGMILSTLSSIFIAAPLAVELGNHQPGIKEHTRLVLSRRSNTSTTDEKEEATMEPMAAPAFREPGQHLGQAAQPKRKKRNKR